MPLAGRCPWHPSPPTQAVDLGHGKRIDAPPSAGGAAAEPGADTAIAAIAPDDRLVAIVERRGARLKVVTGFPRRGGAGMIEWFTWVQVAVAVVAGVLCLVLGFAGRVRATSRSAPLALVELLLVVQLVVAIVAPAFGNEPTGSVLEFYVYLVGGLLLPPPPCSGRCSSAAAGARSCSASPRSRSR